MNSLLDQQIYNNQIFNRTITIPFEKINGNNLNQLILDYTNKNITNRCHKEGYISDKVKILKISGGKLKNTDFIVDVTFEGDICYPYEDMIVNVKIFNITKIGIRAILDDNEKKNPIIVFANRIHNSDINSQNSEDNNNNKYNIGDTIKIKTLGHRFEINDPSIFIIGKII